MDQGLRALLVQKGLAEAQLMRLEAAEEAPQTIGDLGASADSEADARAWAKELGLSGRIAVGRFVQAWQEARASCSSIASCASVASGLEEEESAEEPRREAREAAREDDAAVGEQEIRIPSSESLDGFLAAVCASSADAAGAASGKETAEGSGASASASWSASWSSGDGSQPDAPASSSSFSSCASGASSSGSSPEATAPKAPAPAPVRAKRERPQCLRPLESPPASPQSAAAASSSAPAASSDPFGSALSAQGVKGPRSPTIDKGQASRPYSQWEVEAMSGVLKLGCPGAETPSSKPNPIDAAHKSACAAAPAKKDLTKMLASCPLFEGLSQQALKEVCKKLVAKGVKAAGEMVFSAGQHAREMYFISAGEVEIRGNDGACLASLGAGEFFGEIGVLYDFPRTASAVVSLGPCHLHALSMQDLERVAKACGFQQELRSRGQALQSVRSWFVARLPLFAKCATEPGFVNAVASVLQVRSVRSGETVVTEGHEGHEMFFIFSGTVTVLARQRRVQLSAPCFFGEVALLYAEPRSATVRCAEACSFYVLDRESLHRIMQEFPRVIGMMYSTAQEATNLKAHFIRKIPLFKAMVHNEEFIANMQLALKSFSAAPGEFLVRQGDMSDGRMFLIAHGHAEVRKVKAPGEAAQIVATLGAGAIFGEVALLLDTPRVASVIACGHCHVYTLSRDAFETLAVVYEAWWKELISERGTLLKQLQNTGIGIGATATTKTHNLQMPQLAGTSASTMLQAAEGPAEPCNVPESRLCSVCRTQEKCILSTPCGHIAACAECHPALRNCPLCRQRIEKGVKAYF